MIEIEDVSFTYEGEKQKSLNHVSLSISKGECILLTGPSGCGKTTLLRVINGLIPHFYHGIRQGRVMVCKEDPASIPLYRQADRTSMVFQNPKTQFYTTDPESEIVFSLENQGMKEQDIIDRLAETVNDLNIGALMNHSLFAMSGGERQKIACACADAADTDIILMDEPTANLDYESSEILLNQIRKWKKRGKTILIAEHRIAWIKDTADRIVIMNHGRIEEIAASGVSLKAYESILRVSAPENPLDLEVPVYQEKCPSMEIRNLHFSYDGKHPVLNFESIPIAEGKITAVAAGNGRGKTTLLRCLAGLEKKDRSVLHYRGKDLHRKERRQNVYLIAQDVNYQLLTQEVREEIQISLPADIRNDPDAAEQTVCEIAASLDLSDVLDRDPADLSGGQKQRTAAAAAIASGRSILLFDEPTSGLDFQHMMEISDLLKKCSAAGKTVLVATHDSELIRSCADYLLRFR